MGFVGPGRNRLVEELGLERDGRGFIRANERHQSSQPNVFVAGDMSRGASLVVRAIADGQSAGRDVASWLESR
jgi:glutamate synthase (NADPH) small chain